MAENEIEKSGAIEGELVDVGGAPTKYTASVVNRLVDAFSNGFNITEACQHANISRETYYTWLKTESGFSDKMDRARTALNRKAKENITGAINAGDANASFRYLERRDPDFKAKGELELSPGRGETRSKIKEFLDDDADNTEGDSEPSAPADSETPDEVAETAQDIS